MSATTCVFVGCTARKSKNRGLSFHHLPAKKHEWRIKLLNVIKSTRADPINEKNLTICSRHFENVSTSGKVRRFLRPESLPTLNMPVKSITTPKPSSRPPPEMEMYEEKACKKMCCVPGCDNDLLSISLGVPFHKLPNDAQLRSLWIRVIGNEYVTEDMPVNTLKKRYVCGKHFKPSDYIEDIKSKLAPHIYRYRPILLKTAIPSIMMPEIDDLHIESDKPEDLVAGISLFTSSKKNHNRPSHLRRKGIKCEFCGKYFSHRKEIDEHQGLQMFGNLYKCGHCPQSYDELYKLNTHIKRKHNSNQRYKCNKCSQIFIRATDIKNHVQEHIRIVQAHTCGVCGLNLCSSHLLSEHIERHCVVITTTSGTQTVVIETPQQSEQPKKRLVSLLHGNFQPDLKIQDTYSHTCNTCQQIFPNQTELQNHTLLLHSLRDTYECFYCKQVFSQSHTLEIHMKVHIGQQLEAMSNDEELDIGQEVDQYQDTGQYNDIMETSELDGSNRSISPVNSYAFPNQFSMSTNHICDVCGESFPSSIPLHVHRKIFHGERPHKCEVCKETFQLKISLVKHFDKKHSGKPYKCDVCLKLYRNRYAIKNHRERHVNAIPLECSTCSLCFDDSDTMFRHVKADH